MPFLTPLKVQLLNDREEFPWLTLDILSYQAKDGTIHTVQKYFRTDGASVTPLLSVPVIGQALALRYFGEGVWQGFKCGVLHDWARRKDHNGITPMPAASAHLLLKECLEESGYPEDLVENYYAAVVAFNSKD